MKTQHGLPEVFHGVRLHGVCARLYVSSNMYVHMYVCGYGHAYVYVYDYV